MSNHELNEDAIDLQELQAQIDLSMSFAQNLVTSWVKPTHSAQQTKQNDLENELKEYMRRPARYILLLSDVLSFLTHSLYTQARRRCTYTRNPKPRPRRYKTQI